MSRRQPSIDLDDQARDTFLRRLLQDVWAEAEAAYWERRAHQLKEARPRPGDFTGNATPAEITARWLSLTDAAAACRARAQLDDIARTQAEEALADVAQEPLDYFDNGAAA